MVGAGGLILSLKGSEAKEMSSPTSVDLNAVFGESAENVYAVGRGLLLHHNGEAWRTVATVCTEELVAGCVGLDGRIWLLAGDGSIYMVDGRSGRKIGIPLELLLGFKERHGKVQLAESALSFGRGFTSLVQRAVGSLTGGLEKSIDRVLDMVNREFGLDVRSGTWPEEDEDLPLLFRCGDSDRALLSYLLNAPVR